jgi:tripartite-type tricarboxylate transporter receptor subunit TctC
VYEVKSRSEEYGEPLLLIGLSLVVALLTACGGATESQAEAVANYPRRPITWIVAFDPGGGSDIEARRVQSSLEDKLGTRIQVQYRSGGGGAVGWSDLVKQNGDGYTVGGLVIPHIIIQPLALDDTGYATEEITPVAWNVSAPAALLVVENGRFETIEQFMTYAREHPGELTVGGVETFSTSDLALAQLIDSSGIDVDYVPLTGGAGPLLNSLRGGHVDAVMLGTSHAVGADGIAALAVAGSERFETLPDVPTFKELGYEVTIEYAWGVGMPADTPDAIATKFGNAVIEVMKETGVAEALLAGGLSPLLIGPDEAAQYVARQKTTYEALMPLLDKLNR